MKNRKGFTLIELLAVIVILGLLMAIAIPSVTKYITQSRKKTVTTTIGNYIGALTNEVNDMEYIFTASNTVYAVPIECIALERGGTNPFGKWYQANDAYWAYVLVQYNDATSSYTYGFTFKDSAGYGLYPTTSEKLKESGSQILTDLDLNRPQTGKITAITVKENWLGFEVNDDTNLVVLEATSEGETGNGQTTCTLCQKGDNYTQVEEDKELSNASKLTELIRDHNTLITSSPTLTTSSNNTSDASGLYSSALTNNGSPTYYFRGKVNNNYVFFAGLTWRIIRINETGTTRLIVDSPIFGGSYKKFSSNTSKLSMFYSESDVIKGLVNDWYSETLSSYDSYIATELFCEQGKATPYVTANSGISGTVSYDAYEPNYYCKNDTINNKGILYLKVGLITYDEAVFAGGFNQVRNPDYYLYNSTYPYYWTMSPSGYLSSKARCWNGFVNAILASEVVTGTYGVRPVINLNSGVTATGTGTIDDPYVIQSN